MPKVYISKHTSKDTVVCPDCSLLVLFFNVYEEKYTVQHQQNKTLHVEVRVKLGSNWLAPCQFNHISLWDPVYFHKAQRAESHVGGRSVTLTEEGFGQHELFRYTYLIIH